MTNVSQIYKRTEVVGRGKFGIVYKGIHRTTKQVYAIKVLNLDTSEDEVKDVQQEIQFLSHLKHVPNVTHYYGSYLNGTKLWIIMDFCAGGSLRTLLRPGRLEEKYIGVIVRELLVALQYIHKQNVIHRDIKAANVLITNEGKVQLCDFGVAAQLTATHVRRNTMAGTPYWMAPEVIMEGTSYDVKADIWSLGITIYEIATCNPPYCDKEALRAMQLITKSKPPRLDGKQYSPLLKEIIALCLDENPQERLSAEELLKSKFVRFHKNSPTSLLKELISRYLLWREKKSSRESMIMNVEDDVEEQEIEVKWDFDSLSSSEYILENDININNIQLDDNGDEATIENSEYDDGVDQFMTGYRGFDANAVSGTVLTTTGKINNTSNVTFKNNTVTNMGSTLRNDGTTTRKEAPKSLLQLFEEPSEYDEDDSHNVMHPSEDILQSQYELPKISSAAALHNLANGGTGVTTPRVSTPIKEIEIPNFDEIEQLPTSTQQLQETRSRANTLLHTQSAPILETAPVAAKKTLDPGLQRRPTISSTSLPQTQQQASIAIPPPTSHPPSAPAPSLPSGSANPPTIIPNIPRITPSPKRETGGFQSSPSKLAILTSSPGKGTNSVSMKAIQSPNNISPLLQPLNGINPIIQQSSQSTSAAAASGLATSAKSPPTGSAPPIKRNYQNLRLQMPTPTTNFPKLLHATSNVSNQEVGASDQDENLNQFGVNVSNIPMAMTPLTEKPLTSAMASTTSSTSQPSSVPKRKPTISGTLPLAIQQLQQQHQQSFTPTQQPQQFPFLQREASAVSSVSSHEGVTPNTTNSTIETGTKVFTMPASLDSNLFLDSENSRERLLQEVNGLLGSLHGLLGGLEDKLTGFY